MTTIPILYIGMPGIGKTAKIHQQYDYVEVLLASSMTEEDIAGIPYRDGQYDVRTVPNAMRNLERAAGEGKTTALFLDELDKARRSVADTLLTLIASRKVGNTKLPASTDIIAAANPPEWGGGDGISDAMLSRFAAIPVEPIVSEWVSWAKNTYNDPVTLDIIEAISCGEIPIADLAGEDLNRRITCPRTLAMALEYISSGQPKPELRVRGLLTPATASQVLNLMLRTQTDLSKKAAIVRGGATSKTIQPVRL